MARLNILIGDRFLLDNLTCFCIRPCLIPLMSLIAFALPRSTFLRIELIFIFCKSIAYIIFCFHFFFSTNFLLWFIQMKKSLSFANVTLIFFCLFSYYFCRVIKKNIIYHFYLIKRYFTTKMILKFCIEKTWSANNLIGQYPITWLILWWEKYVWDSISKISVFSLSS